MALKALLLRKRLDDASRRMDALKAEEEALKTREADLEKAIAEMPEDADMETRNAVEESVAAFEADRNELQNKTADLTREIGELEAELAEEEAQAEPPAETPEAPPEETFEERKDEIKMRIPETRARMFGANQQERAAFFAREDVKEYLAEIRACIREKRALSNVGLTIPDVFLGVLRQNIEGYSKLYKHVNVRQIGGDGRMVVMGTIPEAVWTDCCANLNELDLQFNDVELGCWKVGGFFAVCNATLEDSDLDLASELVSALGQAIGLALDKAILYGTGTRMPLGIVPRLAQTSKPGDYPATARDWADLHSSNIKTTAATGVGLYQAIVTNMAAAKGKYSRGQLVHVMNETTYAYMAAQAMSINGVGIVTTGIGATMPVVGGVIEILDFVPDYNIVSGYFDLYLLAERAGEKFASSEHYRFVQDQTIFKGTARYDGQPAIAEGFVVNAVNNQSASTASTFADDDANSVQSIALNTNTAAITGTGTFQLVAFTAPGTGEVTWASGTTAKATVSSTGLVTGVTAGTSVITATCNGLTAQCTVTVS